MGIVRYGPRSMDHTPPGLSALAGVASGYLGTKKQLEDDERERAQQQARLDQYERRLNLYEQGEARRQQEYEMERQQADAAGRFQELQRTLGPQRAQAFVEGGMPWPEDYTPDEERELAAMGPEYAKEAMEGIAKRRQQAETDANRQDAIDTIMEGVQAGTMPEQEAMTAVEVLRDKNSKPNDVRQALEALAERKNEMKRVEEKALNRQRKDRVIQDWAARNPDEVNTPEFQKVMLDAKYGDDTVEEVRARLALQSSDGKTVLSVLGLDETGQPMSAYRAKDPAAREGNEASGPQHNGFYPVEQLPEWRKRQEMLAGALGQPSADQVARGQALAGDAQPTPPPRAPAEVKPKDVESFVKLRDQVQQAVNLGQMTQQQANQTLNEMAAASGFNVEDLIKKMRPKGDVDRAEEMTAEERAIFMPHAEAESSDFRR